MGIAVVVLSAGCGGLSLGGLSGGDDDDTDPMRPDSGPMQADGTGDDPPLPTLPTTGFPEPSGSDESSLDGGTMMTTLPPPSTVTTTPPPPPPTVSDSDTFTTTFPTTDDGPIDPFDVGFGDCVNAPVKEACIETENCFVDDAKQPTFGVCQQPCDDVEECPLPPLGNSTMVCVDIDADVQGECVLFCGDTTECPNGMVCFGNAMCAWPVATENYADCLDDPDVCGPAQECLTFDAPPWAVCSTTGCDGAPGLCPEPPAGGTAVPVCDFDWNTDGVADCTLDCSGGQSCPVGMSCQENLLCAWPDNDLECADLDIGSALGGELASGSTFGQGDDVQPFCTAANANDVIVSWTAPEAGVYSFSLQGSDYDTVMMLWADCGGPSLACNDDGVGVASQITLPLAAGQTVLIVIDGFDENGNWVLGILG